VRRLKQHRQPIQTVIGTMHRCWTVLTYAPTWNVSRTPFLGRTVEPYIFGHSLCLICQYDHLTWAGSIEAVVDGRIAFSCIATPDSRMIRRFSLLCLLLETEARCDANSYISLPVASRHFRAVSTPAQLQWIQHNSSRDFGGHLMSAPNRNLVETWVEIVR